MPIPSWARLFCFQHWFHLIVAFKVISLYTVVCLVLLYSFVSLVSGLVSVHAKDESFHFLRLALSRDSGPDPTANAAKRLIDPK